MVDDSHKKELDTVFEEIIWSVLAGVHTIRVGQIQSFDPTTQLAKVQIVNKTKYEHEDEAKPITVLEDVLCIFPGDGDFYLTFTPKPQSYCVLFVNARSLDNWYETGGIVDPDSARKFDLSDCIALVGLNPKILKLPLMNDGIALRNRTMTTFVNVLEESVSVKAPVEITTETPLGKTTLAVDGSFDVNGNLKVLV